MGVDVVVEFVDGLLGIEDVDIGEFYKLNI